MLHDRVHGTSGTITTSGGWAAEGLYVVPAGASVTFSQGSANTAYPLGYNFLSITGNTSVSDVKVRFPVESFLVAKLSGKTCTFQVKIGNSTGAALTPTISVVRATAGQDNYTSNVTDVSAVSLQSIANGAQVTVGYAFAANAASYNGLCIDIGFGGSLNSNAKSIVIAAGFDLRETDTAVVGAISLPPTPEVRDAASDILLCERYYQTSYENGVATGTSTHAGISGGATGGSAAVGVPVPFRTRMRAAPTMSTWDGAGNSSKYSYYSSNWTDNVGSVSVVQTGAGGFIFTTSVGVDSPSMVHYAADASITGA